MAQTPEGAKKAIKTMKSKYGRNIFKKIGHDGGTARNKSDKKYSPFRERESSYASEMGKKGAEARWSKNKNKSSNS